MSHGILDEDAFVEGGQMKSNIIDPVGDEKWTNTLIVYFVTRPSGLDIVS